MHDPLVFDHLAYQCYKIYVGNWTILRSDRVSEAAPTALQIYGFEEGNTTDQEVFRMTTRPAWAKGATVKGRQEAVHDAVGHNVRQTRGYPWLWSRDSSQDRLLQFHVDREDAQFPLSDGCGAFKEHERSGPRGPWDVPPWLEKALINSENFWPFDAVFPNATVKYDDFGHALSVGVAPARFSAAELMWRSFVDIGLFEQMKQAKERDVEAVRHRRRRRCGDRVCRRRLPHDCARVRHHDARRKPLLDERVSCQDAHPPLRRASHP